jgi:hypothetical protein
MLLTNLSRLLNRSIWADLGAPLPPNTGVRDNAGAPASQGPENGLDPAQPTSPPPPFPTALLAAGYAPMPVLRGVPLHPDAQGSLAAGDSAAATTSMQPAEWAGRKATAQPPRYTVQDDGLASQMPLEVAQQQRSLGVLSGPELPASSFPMLTSTPEDHALGIGGDPNQQMALPPALQLPLLPKKTKREWV